MIEINKMLDESQLNYRTIAMFSGAIWTTLYYAAGKKHGIHWYAFIHAIISSIGSLICLYIDTFEAVIRSGIPEPLRTIYCEGPLTILHSILPMISLGYAMTDTLYGLTHPNSADVLFHGVIMGGALWYVCEHNIQYSIMPMMLMEVSSIPLALGEAEFLSQKSKTIMLILFAITFALIRILLVPYIWANFLWTYYHKDEIILTLADKRLEETKSSCFDDKVMAVIVFGCLFHALNFYWLIKIIKKVLRKMRKAAESKNIKDR